MKFLGLDHRPQEQAEVGFVPLGEAILGDDVGGAGIDEEVEVVFGFGDACQDTVGALLLHFLNIGYSGLLKALVCEEVIGDVFLGGLLADGALGHLGEHNESEDEQKGEDNDQPDGGINRQNGLLTQEHEQTLQKEQEEQKSGDYDGQNIGHPTGAAEVGTVEFHQAVARAAHNSVMSSLLLIITPDVLKYFQKYKVCSVPREDVLREHRELYNYIQNGDSEGAMSVVRHHLSTLLEFSQSQKKTQTQPN